MSFKMLFTIFTNFTIFDGKSNYYVIITKVMNINYLTLIYVYYRFVGSLIASDLLSSTVLGPLLVSGIKNINKALTVFVATSTIFSILVIAMDRYTAVLSPLHYATNVTRQKSVLGMYLSVNIRTKMVCKNLISIIFGWSILNF